MVYKSLIFVILLAGMIACKQQRHSEAQPVNSVHKDRIAVKKDFSHVRFASTLDLGCYMPISAGVEDTAIVNGKVYGFCSKECKEEFEKDPLANIKAGEARTQKKSP